MNHATTTESSITQIAQQQLKAELLQKFAAKARALGSRAATPAGIKRALQAHDAFRAKTLPNREHIERPETRSDYRLAKQWRRRRRFYARASQKLLTQHVRNGWGGQQTHAEFRLRDEYELARLPDRVAEHLAAAWPYWLSGSSRASGERRVSVSIVPRDQVDARRETENVRSANEDRPGTNSYARLCITQRAVRTLGISGLVISGLVSLDARRVGPREYRAAWAAQSGGVDLKVEHGYIIRGYHIVTDSLKLARRMWRVNVLRAMIEGRPWVSTLHTTSYPTRHQ